ncbi:MAG: DNA-directed RNA polymerase subunit L [Thermoprotei archaeon ex4572_64]|nr:MAG: DNA-directed RNA polymerase subunit L [Thermoprotei archaeon ex4572_64]
MLRVRVTRLEDNYLEAIVQGETHTLFAPLIDYLLKHPDVEYAMYDVDHPLLQNVKFRLKTRSRNPVDILREVINSIISDVEELEKKLTTS